VYPGASVQGVKLNGLTREEALARLRSHFTPFEQRAATLYFETNIWSATLADLGGSIDYDATLDTAMAHGRESFADRYTTFFAADDSTVIQPVITIDEAKTRAYLETLAPAIDIEARNARLFRSSGEIRMIDSVDGRALDRDAAVKALSAIIRAGTTGEVNLQTRVVAPEVSSAALEKNKSRAITLIGEAVALNHGDLVYTVSAEQLAQALVIDSSNNPQIDATRLADRLDAIAADIFVPPTNVMLGWDDGLYVVKDDIDGLELDREATEALIVQLASGTERSGALPTRPAKAAARADNLDELGIETHLAYGSSSYAGSSWERATNVAVAAENISYKLVAPGETFSFNNLMGPITTDMGFVTGTIISGDWTTTDIGGGVCQTSTTVFRAAARAGFLFTEWHAHTWRLGFYELDGSPPGFDAAIYQPNGPGQMTLDLSWQNTLDSWLLIMVVVDGSTVTAHLYGKDPGWTVTFGDVWVSDPIKPGKPVERVNPNLARGERKWVSGAAPGYQVVLPRTVVASDGTVISEGSFVSDYLPQPEVWEVGPK
jgi:vancomycin resistance protein YoaR